MVDDLLSLAAPELVPVLELEPEPAWVQPANTVLAPDLELELELLQWLQVFGLAHLVLYIVSFCSASAYAWKLVWC